MAKEGYRVYGIDNSLLSLKFAKKIFKDKNVKGQLIFGNGFKLPYLNNYFDLVFNIGVIEHFPWKKQEKFVKEMVRVSKRYILISVPNDSPNSFFNEYKKTSYFVEGGEDYIPNFKKLAKKFSLNIVFLSGSHIIVCEDEATIKNKKFYKKFNLTLPKKTYSKTDLKSLVNIEKKIPDKILYNMGFLKYFLAKK